MRSAPLVAARRCDAPEKLGTESETVRRLDVAAWLEPTPCWGIMTAAACMMVGGAAPGSVLMTLVCVMVVTVTLAGALVAASVGVSQRPAAASHPMPGVEKRTISLLGSNNGALTLLLSIGACRRLAGCIDAAGTCEPLLAGDAEPSLRQRVLLVSSPVPVGVRGRIELQYLP